MTKIVNNNKLNLILTNYGLERIAEAVEDPTLNLNINKIKLGSGNNHEYYEPEPTQTALKGDLGLEFYIYDKELLEDNLTVSFHTIIPDDIGGFDIREVGLYEDYEGEDRLFAISTQQPFVKPSPDDFYFINVDYYIFLKSQNFADVYEQIVLDVQHAQVTESDVETLTRTFLFAQGNLINQIGNNSEIIGYNRATQLYEKIEENRKNFGYITSYKNYTTLLDFVSSYNKIFSYWLFDYSRKTESADSIVDLSRNMYNLSTNIPTNLLERTYSGFAPMLNFKEKRSYFLSSQVPIDLYNPASRTDCPFTMLFLVNSINFENTKERTLIAKSDYAKRLHTFEVKEMPDESIMVRLFSDPENYLTFQTMQGSVPKEAHVIALSYDPNHKTMTFYINSKKYVVEAYQTGDNYTHMSESSGVLYAFDGSPEYDIYAPRNESSEPIEPLYYKNPNNPEQSLSPIYPPKFVQYTGTEWEIDVIEGTNKVLYEGHIADYLSAGYSTDKLYAWIPPLSASATPDKIVYTKYENNGENSFDSIPTLYTEKYERYYGNDFSIEQDDITRKFIIKYYSNEDSYEAVYDQDENINEKDLFLYQYKVPTETIFTNSPTDPTVLYEKNPDGSFSVYSGDIWTIVDSKVYCSEQLAVYNPTKDEETEAPDLTSYVIGADGYPEDYVDSYVGLISIVKERLSDEKLRALALNLCATLGRNPYIGGF